MPLTRRVWGAALGAALLTSPALAGAGRSGTGDAGPTGASAHAFGVNRRLGRGVNVIGYDPIWKDRAKARFQEGYFSKIRQAGFDSVRVNLFPFGHMDAAKGQAVRKHSQIRAECTYRLMPSDSER